MSTPRRIAKIRQQRDDLLDVLVETKAMLRGTFARTFRRCGKPNCWCAADKGHPSLRVTWTDEGQPRTKAIPPSDIGWAKAMTENYRRFRNIRRQLRDIEHRLGALLDVLENELVTRTKRQRDYFCK